MDLDNYGEWTRKGATMSDKSVRKEFGLTQDEILAGIDDGTLQFRESVIYGVPWYRLLRREVEVLVRKLRGDQYLDSRVVRTELLAINRELAELKKRVAALEERKAVLTNGGK